MDSLRQDDNKKKESQSIFTKETFGVILVLFATLILICLITREAIFSLPGQYVNAFLTGCFGYFSFVLTIFVGFLGVLMIIGKKTGLSGKTKFFIFAIFALLAIFIHTITMSGSDLTFGEYLALSYTKGEGGVATCSGGGFFTGLIAYPLMRILSEVGLYVVTSVLIILCGYAIWTAISKALDEKARRTTADKFRSSYVSEENPTEPATPQTPAIDGLEVREYPISGVDFTPEKPNPKQKLFVNDATSFEFKSRRELKNNTNTAGVTLQTNSHGMNVAGAPNTNTTYNTSYKNDMQERLDYIRTPAKIDLNRVINNTNATSSTTYVSPNNTNPTISNPIPLRQESQPVVNTPVEPVVEETSSQINIPLFEHDESANDSAESHARTFSENYLEVEELDDTTTSSLVVEEVSQTPTFHSLNDSDLSTKPVETPIEPQQEIPMVEESVDDMLDDIIPQDDSLDMSNVESDEVNDQPNVEDQIPPSRIRTERTRSILFDDEDKGDRVGFTSRVDADNNGRSRRLFGESQEPVKEEKPEPPKVEKEPVPINRVYVRPPFDLLERNTSIVDYSLENHQERMEIIKQTLEEFHISAIPESFVQGPAFTRYEIKMPPGISVKKVLGYDDDLKMRLSAKAGVRIEAPIPGKNLVGIEVPNKVKVKVGFREVMEDLTQNPKKGSLMFAVGKDIVGNSISYDLAKGPHYLIAGATSSGKSVCLHAMIVSLLMRYSPEELKVVLIDPKSIEFCKYEHIPHLLVDEIITDSKRAITLLDWAYNETTRRNEMFRTYEEVSNIDDYNSTVASDTVAKLPRIVFFIDELADLMESCKKELEEKIRKIAAKSRSAGIHLVLATQRPSVDVVTGTIKANLPSRIALRVSSAADSSTILGGGGAEKLLGNGDMLFRDSVMSEHERYQGAYLSNREIANVVKFIIENNKAYFDDEVKEYLDKQTAPPVEESNSFSGDGDGGDAFESNDLLIKALALAVSSGTISISQLQRRFQIGYARAGGLVDKMERYGYISGNEGSKARKVLMTRDEFEDKFGTSPESF